MEGRKVIIQGTHEGNASTIGILTLYNHNNPLDNVIPTKVTPNKKSFQTPSQDMKIILSLDPQSSTPPLAMYN